MWQTDMYLRKINYIKNVTDRQTYMYLSKINYIKWQTDIEQRNENAKVLGALKINFINSQVTKIPSPDRKIFFRKGYMEHQVIINF